jgi:hypothetical protein
MTANVGDKVYRKGSEAVYTVNFLEGSGRVRLQHEDGYMLWDDVCELVPIQEAHTPVIDGTLSERGSRYGKFNSVATIVQDLKDVMHNSPNWSKLTASQKEALEMIQHKIARMLNGDTTYIDNAVDIVGYATLMMKNMQGDLEI